MEDFIHKKTLFPKVSGSQPVEIVSFPIQPIMLIIKLVLMQLMVILINFIL